MVFIRRSGDSGDDRDIVLCEACARDRGIVAGKGGLDLNFDELIGASLDPFPPRSKTQLCPGCGRALAELLREGRLGCASCADAFSVEILRSLGRKAPYLPDEERDFLAPGAIGEGARVARPSDLEARLEAALSDEDYEKAALLRDEIASGARGAAASSALAFPADFPIHAGSFAYSGGPDDDVVLWSSAALFRNVESLPFPGSPRASPAPSRSLLLERFRSCGSWLSRTMADLGPVARRSLSERGVLPRSYAADDEAVLLSTPSEGVFALLDEGDHLRLRAFRPGFDPRSALSSAIAQAERIGREVAFARRPDIGWLCSRLSDCGIGASISALVHLPAVAAAGMRDRLFRALMAEGAILRGFYSTGEESSGALYVITIESSTCSSLELLVRSLSSAIARVVQYERRLRAEIQARNRLALVDAEGRAFGTARYCALLGSEEATSLVSTLRLASLRGSLKGVELRALAALLLSLGAGSLAYAQGMRELPESEAADLLRARAVKAALGKAEYSDMVKEGA
jgi:protein-arginine kinase/protein-arginine kinase activator protein McsA